LIFTYNRSLELWNRIGILNREISLYKRFLEKNVRVSFLTYGDDSDLNYKSIIEDIKIIPIKDLIKTNNSKSKLLKSLIISFKLREEFKIADVIKTNQLEGSWITWIPKIFFHKKLVIRGGFEWLKFYILKKKKGFLKYWLGYFWRYFIEFISYNLADEIIVTNPEDIDFIINKFRLKKKKNKIHLIYNFIDTELFRPINLNKHDKRVLFIGRFNYQKNLFNLLESFRYLKGFSLDLIGKGPLMKRLIDKSREIGIPIRFLDEVPNNMLPEIMNKYQIFILPSFYEGNPKVLLEAMSCGLACITSNVYGINNIIDHQYNGYLCNLKPQSIANAIKTVYNNKDLINKMGKNARDYILMNCSLDSITNKELLIYKNLLSNKPSDK